MLLTAHAVLVLALFQGAPAAAATPAEPEGLPAPFQDVSEEDIQEAVHPGQAKPDEISEARLWKGEGTPRLLVLFGRTEASTYEVALLGLEKGALTVVARYVETVRWDDAKGFDLAPYRVTKDRTAFGVKYQRNMSGATGDFVKLYLRSGTTFRPIFEHVIYYSATESDDWGSATIQLAPGQGEFKDLVVVNSGNARERWVWDAKAQAYREK